ncbi:fimbrial biogenesis chaperone [Enterobacter asburiae]|uniref:fimbrial biogenesis chaperone n=1 Tax=Enterobacter asburiae TaxID=61645 RepID=UPI003F54E258
MRKTVMAVALMQGLMMVSGLSQAAALQVSPTTVVFGQAGKSERVWLTASGDRPVTGQLRLYQWEQRDGKDVLTPTREVIPSPPVMTVPAGETQLLRLVSKVPAGPKEKALRLIVDELPEAGAAVPQGGVQFLLKYSIPVFIPPAGGALARPAPGKLPDGVTFTLRQTGKESQLVADNARNAHIRLAGLEYVTNAGSVQVLRPGLLGYVLAGGHQQWTVKTPAGPGYFRARVNDDTTPASLLSWSR